MFKKSNLKTILESTNLSAIILEDSTIVIKDSGAAIPSGITLLGTGYNSVTGELLSPNIIYSEDISTDSTVGVHAVALKASIAKTYSELSQQMGIEAGASFGFSAFSASAKVKSLNELHTNNSSNYLLVKNTILHYTRQLAHPLLSNKTAVKNRLRDYNIFFGYGGDEYVYNESFGGELYILFSSEAHSRQEKSSNEQKFSAATSFINLGGSANITKAVESLSTSFNLQITLYQNGGTGFSADSISLDSLFKYALNFKNQVEKSSVLVSFDHRQYNIVDNFPSNYQGFPPIESEKKYMDSIVKKLLLIQSAQGEAGFVSRNQGLFDPHFVDSIGGINSNLSNKVIALQQCANHCRNAYSITNCKDCPTLHDSDISVSVLLPDKP